MGRQIQDNYYQMLLDKLMPLMYKICYGGCCLSPPLMSNEAITQPTVDTDKK